MSLQLVFGSAGCGKSTYLQQTLIEEAAKNPKRNYILLVPDQFTMQTQMDVVKKSEHKGILNIDVLSFNRLAYRVFSETGAPTQLVLDDTGKSLVLRHVAESVAKDMPYIGKNLNKVGYIHEVKSTISEFMQYGVSVKDVEHIAGTETQGLLSIKLKDLAVIYGAFLEYNKGKYITGEESLDILCRSLDRADFIRDSVIVFDGFTGFTPIQERVILRLMQLASKVYVSFTLADSEAPSETGASEKLFYLSRRSANRLRTLAGDNGVMVDSDYIINNEGLTRFSNNPELSHLEKSLFRYPSESYDRVPENITLFKCNDIGEEVSEIALRIHNLVEKEGYAYRDIAVVVGNLDSYASTFETRLNELDMPFFIDRTNSVSLNPFTEYIKSALQMIIRDYSYDSVFHYLRSGFADFTDAEVDRFDKYVSSINFRGAKAYHRELTKRQKGRPTEKFLAEIPMHEAFRVRLMEQMAVLERPAKTAADYVHNLYDFIVANNSYDKLADYANLFTEQNDLSKAKEYGQIYRLIMELLDTIISIVGDEEMELEEFYKILEAGILEIKVGTIPKNVDRIVVGDIERTRLNGVKALFFAGVNDGNIPKSGDKRGLLSDMDREGIAERNKINLAPTAREEMYTQRLYLYMMLLKPTHKLFISYAAKDAEGKGVAKSYLVDVISEMFPLLKEERVRETINWERLVTKKDSLRYYSTLLRDYVSNTLHEGEKELVSTLSKLYSETEDNREAGNICDAAFTEYKAKPLAAEIVKALYGEILAGSISSFEQYAGCAYRYFLSAGLKLKEDEEYDFTGRDLGTVYHDVLDAFATLMDRRNLSWKDLTDEQISEMITEAVEIYCENYEQGILLEDEQTASLKLRIAKVMERTVKTLKFQFGRGLYNTLGHELKFEREIPIEGGLLRLNGRIDRIDLFEKDGKLFVKIIDFKSREMKLDVTDIYHGIRQQLCVYMSEAVKHEQATHPEYEVIPAGMFYYGVINPIIDMGNDVSDAALSKVEDKILSKLRLSGIMDLSSDSIEALDSELEGTTSQVLQGRFNKESGEANPSDSAITADQMKGMLEYVEKMVVNIGEGVLRGNKAVSPMEGSGCEYCNYRGICRFDEKIPGFKVRDGKEISKEDAMIKVTGGGADGMYLFD